MAIRTLRQLAERLNAIIAENDKRGWSERNDLPAAIEVTRTTKTGRHKASLVYSISYVSSAQHRMADQNQYCGVVTASEHNLIQAEKGR